MTSMTSTITPTSAVRPSNLNVLGRHLVDDAGTVPLVRSYRLSDEVRAAGAWQTLAAGAFINRTSTSSHDLAACRAIRENLACYVADVLDDVRPDAALSTHVRECGPCARALSQAIALFAYPVDVEFGSELAIQGTGTRALPLPGTTLSLTVTIEEDTQASALKGTRRVTAVIRLAQDGQPLPVAVNGVPRYAVRAQASGLIATPVAIDDDGQGYIAEDLAPSDVRAFVVKVRPELGYRDSIQVAADGALTVTLADGRPCGQTTAAEATTARRRWFGLLRAS